MMLKRLGVGLGRQSIAILALVVATSGGTAYAASAMWTGSNIVDGSLTGADIQNGSITSADLAGGSGGSATVQPLATIDLAPLTTGWSSPTPGPDYTTLAGAPFTMATSGFVAFQFDSLPSLSADAACDGDASVAAVNIYAGVDGHPTPIAAYVSAYDSQRPRLTGSAWLEAGSHSIEVILQSGYCPGVSSGSLLVSDTHMAVYRPIT
jgi:hypothetical protein